MCRVEVSQLDRVDLEMTLVCLTLGRDTQRHTSRVVLIESMAVGRLARRADYGLKYCLNTVRRGFSSITAAE